MIGWYLIIEARIMDVLSKEITVEERQALKDKNVSDSIRYLDQQGYARADIARIIDRRYQHVRNVLIATKDRLAGRKKVTIRLVGDVYREFDDRLKRLGQNRDGFLAELLPDALDSFAEVNANSDKAREILEEVFDISAYEDALEVTFVLPDEQLQRMNDLCEAKNVPQELFMDWVISASSDSLAKALDLLEDPVGAFINTDVKFCQDYLMTDEQAMDLRDSHYDELVLADAIAKVKGVTFSGAQLSLRQLSPQQRKSLRQNPQIKEQLKQIQESDSGPVELDDLLN